MTVIPFPARRLPPMSDVDALLAERTAVEIELVRAQLVQIRLETRQAQALWGWWCFKRCLIWGAVLWLLVTFAKAEPRRFENFYDANGLHVGSSVRPGGGKFTNFYDRNGQFIGSAMRRGVTRR